ncbi:MAG: hypothetical protein B6229_07950 [Spirochaetaceae bacterium 4572_7]|nr:MAG: hypothetical protein B6229_07950 [Spirochaetaceae bacterium 4572_7]
MKKIIAIFLLITTFTLYGLPENQSKEPVPYADNEFPPILYDIRRSSIIFCGAFPLGYMYSSIAADHILSPNSEYGTMDDDGKIEYKLISSLVFSGVIMFIDLIIEKFFRGRG